MRVCARVCGDVRVLISSGVCCEQAEIFSLDLLIWFPKGFGPHNTHTHTTHTHTNMYTQM